eukprot:158557_1
MADNELKSWLATNKLTNCKLSAILTENEIWCLDDIKDGFETMDDLNSLFVEEMELNTALKNTFIKAVVKLNKITDHEFKSWLETNKLTKIADTLVENEIECLDDIKEGLETMDDLEIVLDELHLNTDLKIRFINAVVKLNNIPNQSHDEETNEETKEDVYQPHHMPMAAVLKEPIKLTFTVLVLFLGISKYSVKTYADLEDIHKDEQRLRQTFEKEYGYQFESNEYYGDKEWKKADVLRWIALKRDQILIDPQNRHVRYHALIFCAASHGSTYSIICSDGKPLQTCAIRSLFAENVNESFSNMPKVFIFNCCRTPLVKETTITTGRGAPGSGYGLTITGTEGKEVFGAQLSSFVAAAFSESDGKQSLYEICRTVQVNAEKEMGVVVQEHDLKVDNVVFAKIPKKVKKPQSRGSASLAQTDGTAQLIDDELRNILKPSLGSMDLLKYLDPLREAGFTNKEELHKLTKKKLHEKGIKMSIFHRQELLRRIAKSISNK